jgi:hypothetical protein
MQYMLLIYGPEPSLAERDELMADMTPWNAYTDWLKAQGIYRSADPLGHSTTATTVQVRDGQRLTTDGPFAETKEVLGGYYLIETADLDQALEAAARCPGALWGSIEVRPIAEM